MGSTLLRSTEIAAAFVALARWQIREHWAPFRRTEGGFGGPDAREGYSAVRDRREPKFSGPTSE